MEHHLEKIRNKKKFFFKSFIISLILVILCCVIGWFTFNFFAGMAENMYGVDADDYAKGYILMMGIWKILIVQFTLVPAIAMWMLEKHLKKHSSDI